MDVVTPASKYRVLPNLTLSASVFKPHRSDLYVTDQAVTAKPEHLLVQWCADTHTMVHGSIRALVLLCADHVFHNCMKQLDICYPWTREQVQVGLEELIVTQIAL